MRWTVALAVLLGLLAAPASALAGGTWTAGDAGAIIINWKTDDGTAVRSIRVTLTQPVQSASVDGGAACTTRQDPKEIFCPVASQAGAPVASGRVNATLDPPAACADSFGLTVTTAGAGDVQQQPIVSGNSCGGGGGETPPPAPPPTQSTGDVGSTVGAGQSVAPPHFPIVTSADAGAGPHVKVFATPALTESMSFFAFAPGFQGGVRVAVGDVNGDGRADVITGAGPGAGPHVKVFDGITGNLLRSFFAFDPGFSGGVFVAAGDVNGDGAADLITGAGPGGGPQVKVFDGRTGGQLSSFFAYDASFQGGVRVAAGDVNGDGRAEIITAPGAGTAPQIKIVDGTSKATKATFNAYPGGFAGGVFVAAGDVNGDGLADVVTGVGSGGGPHVKAFRSNGAQLRSFFAYDASFSGGVRVAVGDVNGDGLPDIITATGPGGGPHVKAFDGANGAQLASFFAYDPGFSGGVFVGATARQPVLVRTRTLTFGSGGKNARLPVSCLPAVQKFCRGTAVLGVGASGKLRAARLTVLGRGKFALKPGQRGSAAIKLTRAGRAALSRRGKLTVNAQVVTHDAGGNVTKSALKLTLRAKRAR